MFDPNKCLHFIVLSGELTSIGLNTSPIDSSHYMFSEDGVTWNQDSWNGTLGVDGVIYVKGNNYPGIFPIGTRTFSFSGTDVKLKVAGSVMSLIDDGAGTLDTISSEFGFYNLFANNSVIEEICDGVCSATTLCESCYKSMFAKNSGLKKVGTYLLPATNLVNGCYSLMFDTCKALENIPQLPAKTLVNSCYLQMFKKCTSLKEVPANTILAEDATASSCLGYAFDGCESLKKIHVYFSKWGLSGNSSWLRQVPSVGDFYCTADLPEKRGQSYIPENWIIHRPRRYSVIEFFKKYRAGAR